jgi:hypothetical protein
MISPHKIDIHPNLITSRLSWHIAANNNSNENNDLNGNGHNTAT